uniref:Calmodulin-lysine N-methyltransferase n=1 Tax=Zea mays TaxID=4577 RepID=A0A804R966_MAIZE
MDSSSPSPSSAPSGSRAASNATQRWSILRRALLARSSSARALGGISSDHQIKDGTNNISRKASRGFNLIECHSLPISQLLKSLGNSLNENDFECQKDVYVCYKLPCRGSSKLDLVCRKEDSLELNDIEASNKYNIDTTGLVVGHRKRFLPTTVLTTRMCSVHYRSKKVLELGSGYGLAGLVIAASTNADERLLVRPRLNL